MISLFFFPSSFFFLVLVDVLFFACFSMVNRGRKGPSFFLYHLKDMNEIRELSEKIGKISGKRREGGEIEEYVG